MDKYSDAAYYSLAEVPLYFLSRKSSHDSMHYLSPWTKKNKRFHSATFFIAHATDDNIIDGYGGQTLTRTAPWIEIMKKNGIQRLYTVFSFILFNFVPFAKFLIFVLFFISMNSSFFQRTSASDTTR